MRRLSWSYGLLILPATCAAAAVTIMVVWWLFPRTKVKVKQVESNSDGTRRLKQHVTVELPIPEGVVGYVIGRRGMRVRQLEEETGAQVRFKDVQTSKGKTAVIRGKQECVNAAEEAVRKMVEERLSADANQEETSIEVPVSVVGHIIGKQGTNIRRLQKESGARITVSEGGDDFTRQCIISGSKDAISLALSLVTSIIKESELRTQCSKLSTTTATTRLSVMKLSADERDYFPVFVSSVSSQGDIWIQLIEQYDPNDLEKLVDAMTQYYSQSRCSRLENVQVGCVCAAPFAHDSKWYRVEVTSVTPGGMVDLLYVDYGDEGSVQMDILKPLRSEFTSLPAQAIHCRLHGVQPKGATWSEEALSALEDLSYSACWKPVMVRVMDAPSGLPPSVEIVDTSTDQDVNLAKQMVSLGHADWTKEPSHT